MPRPSGVNLISFQMSKTAASAANGVGIVPEMRPVKSWANETGRWPPGTLKTKSAQPAQMNDVASVTMIAGSLMKVTMLPVASPRSAPPMRTMPTAVDFRQRGVVHLGGEHDRGQTHHLTDREVNATGQHDDRLRHRHQEEREEIGGKLVTVRRPNVSRVR